MLLTFASAHAIRHLAQCLLTRAPYQNQGEPTHILSVMKSALLGLVFATVATSNLLDVKINGIDGAPLNLREIVAGKGSGSPRATLFVNVASQ